MKLLFLILGFMALSTLSILAEGRIIVINNSNLKFDNESRLEIPQFREFAPRCDFNITKVRRFYFGKDYAGNEKNTIYACYFNIENLFNHIGTLAYLRINAHSKKQIFVSEVTKEMLSHENKKITLLFPEDFKPYGK